ncbi:MAG: glycosyltransferase family 2 protein [Armatimonadota bacterium]|nr:glycosyltransferase family 2 protein [Armatimonadota bacterium]
MQRSKPKTTAVVPAYNEEHRVSTVLAAIKQARLVDEIIVVNDGSTDGTCRVASSDPAVTVLDLAANIGKGGAMCSGAAASDADVLLFLDADLIGLKPEQIDDLVRPVVTGEADMAVGVFRAGRKMTDWAQILVPYISGQRALRREVFVSIPELRKVRSGVEVAITKYFRVTGLEVKHVVLSGVTHSMKEEKIGLVRGFGARLKMYYEIGRVVTNGHAIVKAARQAGSAIRASKNSEQ